MAKKLIFFSDDVPKWLERTSVVAYKLWHWVTLCSLSTMVHIISGWLGVLSGFMGKNSEDVCPFPSKNLVGRW